MTAPPLRTPLLLALAALLIVLAAILLPRLIGPRAAPGLDERRDAIATIELTRGDDRVQLARDGDAWAVASFADAPADAAKVDALIDRIVAARDGGAGDARATVHDGKGVLLAALPLADVDLAPAAWTTLRLPRLAAADVRRGEVIGPDGARALDAAARARLLAALAGVGDDGLATGDAVNWAGARYAQLLLTDGTLVSMQLARGDGIAWARLNADAPAGVATDRADAIRALRHHAIRLDAAALDGLLPPG